MSYYQERKERIREEAIDFQDMFLELSWGELQEWTDRLEKLGRRFGLLEEFRENGIL